jgi:hypothetical protein
MTENPYASSWFVDTTTILLFITGLMIPRLRDWFGINKEYHSEEEIHYNSEESENEVNPDDMVEEDDWEWDDSSKKHSQEGHIE